MILFEKTFPRTLDALADSLPPGRAEIWSFDDAPTRRRAEAQMAARGITATCRSTYKPLLCAFREEIGTKGLIRARVRYPRHPAADPRRFLLESYPLTALFPAVAFEFVEGPESTDLPGYDLHLAYANGRSERRSVLAPNRLHDDYSGNLVLSPCGWLIAGGNGAALETDYEALFHRTMAALEAQPWQREPYFQELNISVTLPVADEDLGFADEVLSLREALHEEFYFSLLEVFQRRSARPEEERAQQPGQIVPEIRRGAQTSVRVDLRPYDVTSISGHRQELETAERALSQVQIAEELARIPGERFEARAVSGRELAAVHHPGRDRAVMLSAGQHANETTAPAGLLRAAQRLAERDGAHFTISPLENPDGYALHQRLISDNPRHMHHAARYTALGDDLDHRSDGPPFEQAIRLEAERRTGALLHLNFHGYPSHEWSRPLSGYIPRGFAMWTLPKGFFLIMRHRDGWGTAARALVNEVTLRLANVPGLHAMNTAQIALFERHAGETGFEMLNGFPVMIDRDERLRVPMMLITEYPDETITGPAFRAGHEAQMAAALAAYDALQRLSDIGGLAPS